MADIVLINPRFELSFWGLEHCMRLFGKRANLPVACLALFAALVPERATTQCDPPKLPDRENALYRLVTKTAKTRDWVAVEAVISERVSAGKFPC